MWAPGAGIYFLLILRITAIPRVRFTPQIYSSSQPKRPGLGHTHDSHSALPFGPNFGGISNGDILPNGHALRHMRLWILIYGEFPCPIRSHPFRSVDLHVVLACFLGHVWMHYDQTVTDFPVTDSSQAVELQ